MYILTMKNNNVISSEDWLKAMKSSATYPQVRPDEDSKGVDSEGWIELHKEAARKAPQLLDKEQDDVRSISIGIICLFISIPVCLVLSYIYNMYLSFLSIPIIIALYLYERKYRI